MTHQITLSKNVLTVRISERGDAQAIQQDLRDCFLTQTDPLTVVLDLTTATRFDSSLKALFFRAFQHHLITRVGICGINPEIGRDVREMTSALQQRSRSVNIAPTEYELLVEFGLIEAPTEKREFAGMLSFLKGKGEAQNSTARK